LYHLIPCHEKNKQLKIKKEKMGIFHISPYSLALSTGYVNQNVLCVSDIIFYQQLMNNTWHYLSYLYLHIFIK